MPRVESFIFHFRLSERSSPHNAVRKEWWWEVGRGGGVFGSERSLGWWVMRGVTELIKRSEFHKKTNKMDAMIMVV